uniref:Cleavage and polyadenylation specificity factor subunit 5 n=1 Tax=Blastobotrys adeninivorans TaxID=409370 RepID=A0A060T7D0_BLAAD
MTEQLNLPKLRSQLSFNENDARPDPSIRVYPVSNYTFSVKQSQPEDDSNPLARSDRLRQYYEQNGMRRSCEGVIVCHDHGHPYVLMLQIGHNEFRLPGDFVSSEDDEIAGFKKGLDWRLAPDDLSLLEMDEDTRSLAESKEEWEIGDCLAQWYRPNFESFMYPFIPPHITEPKECKKLYLVHLPQHKVLCIPKNMKVVAVPLFELYDNETKYGQEFAAIPLYLSRYNFEFIGSGSSRVVSRGDW